MRLNIFCIPNTKVEALRTKLSVSRMGSIKEVYQGGWHGVFYYSSDPLPDNIPWAETFRGYFDGRDISKDVNYYAVYFLRKVINATRSDMANRTFISDHTATTTSALNLLNA